MFSDHRFPNLVELVLETCNDLRELPWIFPSLRELRIRECPKLVVLPLLCEIESLHLECCDQIIVWSSSSLSAPHVQNTFLSLRQLVTVCCPNLRELTPVLINLKSLRIENCEQLCSLPMLPSINELRLERCKGMALDNRAVPHLSSLYSLTIDDMLDLESLPNGFMQLLTALKKLDISHCTELTALLQNEVGSDLLPSGLQHLCIRECNNLSKLPQSISNLYCLEELIIEGARGLTFLPEGLNNLTSLRVLRVSHCENLSSLPRDLHALTSLQEFVMESCPALVSFWETGLPITLQELKIINCRNLQTLPMGLLLNLMSLRVLELHGYPNLKSLPEGLHRLTSLQILEITDCPAFESFPDMGLPIVLQHLLISNCGKLTSFPKGLHKLMNLQLEIVECSSFMDCNNQAPLLYLGLCGLTSLSSLVIGGCPALVSIPKGLLPTNLADFCIKNCPRLESLHDGLSDLTSLRRLEIQNCPILTQQYQRKEGEEWPMIAQIPGVRIDGQWQQS